MIYLRSVWKTILFSDKLLIEKVDRKREGSHRESYRLKAISERRVRDKASGSQYGFGVYHADNIAISYQATDRSFPGVWNVSRTRVSPFV